VTALLAATVAVGVVTAAVTYLHGLLSVGRRLDAAKAELAHEEEDFPW
jgi:hypothetical protein